MEFASMRILSLIARMVIYKAKGRRDLWAFYVSYRFNASNKAAISTTA